MGRRRQNAPTLNPLESEIRQAIYDAFAVLGVKYWQTSDRRASRNTPGTPDIIASLGNGMAVLLEVKRPKLSKESAEQSLQSLMGQVETVTSAEEAILAWQKARKRCKIQA